MLLVAMVESGGNRWVRLCVSKVWDRQFSSPGPGSLGLTLYVCIFWRIFRAAAIAVDQQRTSYFSSHQKPKRLKVEHSVRSNHPWLVVLVIVGHSALGEL